MTISALRIATYATELESDAVEIALSVVQGVVTVLSIVGSVIDSKPCDTPSTSTIKIQKEV